MSERLTDLHVVGVVGGEGGFVFFFKKKKQKTDTYEGKKSKE